MLDIANLHAFGVVADKASFSLAAEQLHLTQPAGVYVFKNDGRVQSTAFPVKLLRP